MKTITMQDIRNAWPNPVTLDATYHIAIADPYCVGGGVCRFAFKEDEIYQDALHFPLKQELLQALRVLNPHLSIEIANEHAEQILNLNDDGFFDMAWNELDKALTWKPKRYENCNTDKNYNY